MVTNWNKAKNTIENRTNIQIHRIRKNYSNTLHKLMKKLGIETNLNY